MNKTSETCRCPFSRRALVPVTVFHIWKIAANALRLIKTWRCPAKFVVTLLGSHFHHEVQPPTNSFQWAKLIASRDVDESVN